MSQPPARFGDELTAVVACDERMMAAAVSRTGGVAAPR